MALLDSLLSESDRKEALSIAYAMAVAGRAGYMTSSPPAPDRDSVDLNIRAGGSMRPQLDVQLKATSQIHNWRDGVTGFRLSRNNYDDLRCQRSVPFLLVVLQLPTAENKWMHCDTDSLIIRYCAWWQSLIGEPAIGGKSCTVQLVQNQRFDPAGLCSLMEQTRSSTGMGKQP